MTQITMESAAGRKPVGFSATDLALVGMVLIWGFNYIVLKAVMRQIEPIAFNAVRFPIAVTCLVLFAVLSRAPRPSPADILRLGGLGLLGNTIYQFAFIIGLSHTRAGNAALIMAAVPVQTAVISHLRGAERLRRRDALGLLISFLGIATVVLGSRAGVSFGGSMLGDVLTFAATVCWSFYIVGIKPLADRYGPVTVTVWTMGLGTCLMMLLSIPALRAQDWGSVSAMSWAGVVFSATCSLALAYVIWSRGVQRLGAARTSMYSNLTPFVVALAAWAFLGEQPTAWQAAGAAGIFTGIWLTRT